MKAGEFNPSTYKTSGSYCSIPCAGCPTKAFVTPTNVEAAMATDEVLSTHSTEEVLGARTDELWAWAIKGLGAATVRGFDADGVVVVDAIYAATDQIRKNECPTYELL